MYLRFCIVLTLGLLWATQALAARPDYSALFEALDRDGSAVHQPSGVRLDPRDFTLDGRQVEALAFTPPGAGPFPALLLIPGYSTSARDWAANGIAFAQAGYACLAVSQPGFGKSDGPADFVGPATLAALSEAWRQLAAAPGVDSARMGIVGYSRGAMAASLLATQLTGVRAVVLGGGIYDFQQAFNEIESPVIKGNMVLETGGTEAGLSAAAAAERSSVLGMDKLSAAVLILHGEDDKNAPVSQAYLLRDKLTELGKDFEIQILSGKEHSIGLANFQQLSLDFLGRKMGKAEGKAKG